MSLEKFVRENAFNGLHEGLAGKILPISSLNKGALEEILPKGVADKAQPGKLFFAYADPETNERRAKFLDPIAARNTSIILLGNAGDDMHVNIARMEVGAREVAEAAIEDRQNRAAVDKANDEGRQAAERDGTPFEPAAYRFEDAAFAHAPNLIACFKERFAQEHQNEFSSALDFAETTLAQIDMHHHARLDGVTDAERELIDQKRALQARIASMTKVHAAQEAVERGEDTPEPGEATDKLLEKLGQMGHRLAAGMMNNPEHQRMFKGLMSAFVEDGKQEFVAMVPVSAQGVARIEAEMGAPVANDDAWLAKAVSDSKAMMAQIAPGYEDSMKVRLYSKDGADMLLVGDRVRVMGYAFDTDMRVQDFNLNAALGIYTHDEIPTRGELDDLEARVEELSYDNEQEIVFDMA